MTLVVLLNPAVLSSRAGLEPARDLLFALFQQPLQPCRSEHRQKKTLIPEGNLFPSPCIILETAFRASVAAPYESGDTTGNWLVYLSSEGCSNDGETEEAVQLSTGRPSSMAS